MLLAPWSNSIAGARAERAFKAWRAVEAQHVVSTLRLTGSDPARQELLERILEESKPPLPAAAEQHHYLLSTPFRYPPSGHGSRFRAWPDAGMLYAARERRTACAEMGYWRWRFLRDSTGMTTMRAAAQTVFQLGAGGEGIDLTMDPLRAWRADWTDPAQYGATQALARAARALSMQWIAYESVRDPDAGLCFAVLDPTAIRPRQPLARETWYLTVTESATIWQRERQRFVFSFASMR